MDSKGGRLQTSSGGDDEYSSRAADSISAFFNQQRLPPSHHRRSDASNSSLFDPLSDPYLDPLPPPPLNLDAVFAPGSTFFGSTAAESTIPRAAATDDETHRVRNPRKRSRASRRTPTTVLTTDTANFRAMVQEFTGIPAPPFFAAPSAMRSGPLGVPQAPNYLLRPFAQKLQPLQPPVVSSFPFPSSSMTNQALALQSLLQPSSDPHLKMGVLDGSEFRHGLPNLVSSDGTTNTSRPTSSAAGEASNNAADHSHHLSNSMHANYDYSQSISSGKFKNLHAPAQDMNMIEPWL